MFVFKGRFDQKLDEKGRLILPNSFRGQDSKDLQLGSQQLVVTNGFSKGFKYLDVYPASKWKILENKISKLSSLKAEVQAFQRFYLSGGQPLDLDKNNRILIPMSLRNYAELGDEIIVVGMNDKFEIWSHKIWKKFYDKVTENFDETLAIIAQLEDAPTDRKK
ncbi:MAG: division/cell wall cluster transcriptional repressor MraZ [Bdellovibrionota bacterium]